MLHLANIAADPADVLASGQALDVFKQMIVAQGGDLGVPLPVAAHTRTIEAAADGYITRLDCLAAGVAAWRLGAGRTHQDDPVDAAAGLLCLKKPGESVAAGEPVIELHTNDPDRFDGAISALEGAIEVGLEPLEPLPLVVETIRG